jgi:hypothetical protein
MSLRVGAIGDATRSRVDDDGTVRTDGIEVACWVGADDGWHVPGEDVTRRSGRPTPAPLWETSVRVAGGDVVQRAYGVPGATVLDVENASAEACAIAFVVRVAEAVPVSLEGATLFVDGRAAVVCVRAPRLWVGAKSARTPVMDGAATGDGDRSWPGPIEVALLVPLPHKTRTRIALPGTGPAPDVANLPAPDAVVQSWERHLDRGLRTELPDPWQVPTDAARADVLLAPPSAGVVAALEDWGFDEEVRAHWHGLGFRARRAARRRPRRAPAWEELRAVDAAHDPARYLVLLRRVLLHDRGTDLDVLPVFPPEWLGLDLAAHGIPLRSGSASFALRWHGPRPALLWDVPAPATLHAPALDPSWSAPGGQGETLLDEPPAPLLAMGTTRREGRRVDDPGSFA